MQEAVQFGIDGKVALITGAARGQGRAEAELLAAHGAKVVVADIDEDACRMVAAGLDNALAVKLDVAHAEAWRMAISQTTDAFGRLDILINNAAISRFGPISDLRIEDFMRVINVNLMGTFLGMQKALPLLKQHAGCVINVSSISALSGRVNQSAYMASKWAIRGLSKAAALEFAAHRVRVNTIIPGLITTEMTLSAYGAEGVAERGAAIPVGRAGVPRDIAALALFLASPLSEFCNGAEFVADGGETAGSRPLHEDRAVF